MIHTKKNASQSSNFDLKAKYVDLHSQNAGKTLTVSELEGLRADAASVPASKHGLEVICGASCETGAQ
ncbi:MAG: hypothetical protein WA790_21200 [Sulfitobacter sp.]